MLHLTAARISLLQSSHEIPVLLFRHLIVFLGLLENPLQQSARLEALDSVHNCKHVVVQWGFPKPRQVKFGELPLSANVGQKPSEVAAAIPVFCESQEVVEIDHSSRCSGGALTLDWPHILSGSGVIGKFLDDSGLRSTLGASPDQKRVLELYRSVSQLFSLHAL